MLKKIRAKISRSRADNDADEAGSTHTKPSNNEVNAGAVAGPRDLWQVAFDSLDPKHKPWSSQDKQTPLEVLQEVIDETEKKYTEYKKKKLTIRRRDGGEIKVREVAQKILASALNVQDVIKAIATFDPTGRASSITERVLIAASDTFEVLQPFLEVLGPKVTFPLSDEVVAFVTYQDLSALSWLLKRRGSAVPLTEKAMVIVAGNHDGVKWLLHEWPADIDLNNLWKDIWKLNFDDVLFDGLSSPMSERTRDGLPQIQKRAASNILRCTREIDLSEELFAQTSTTGLPFDDYSGLLPSIEICIEKKLPFPATEHFMRVVLDKCDTDLLKAIHQDLQQFRSLPDHQPGEFEQILWSQICERRDIN